jgi:hypothetical protein
MFSGRLSALLIMVGICATAGAVGCFVHQSDDVTNSDDIRSRSDQDVAYLKSTLVLETGCTAVKVGPNHLLLAARCVSGRSEFAVGNDIHYKIADGARGVDLTLAPTDGGADAGDADAPAATDAGDVISGKSVTIAKVSINDSFEAKCNAPSACLLGTMQAGEVKDIAVVTTLEHQLDTITAIPIDLDTVGQGDPLITVGSGCRTFDGSSGFERLTPTIAVPARAATHPGSPWATSVALVNQLGDAYVVTPGRGWHKGSPELCHSDIGAPLFRADKAAVAGITAGYTSFDPTEVMPVTLQHTRVDTASTVGTWLASLGVETVQTCGGDCQQHDYDGGVPTKKDMQLAETQQDDDGDAGLDGADAGPTGPQGVGLDPGTQDGYSDSDPEYADAGHAKKTKLVSTCSSKPGPVGGGGGFAFIGIGLALAALRRRR